MWSPGLISLLSTRLLIKPICSLRLLPLFSGSTSSSNRQCRQLEQISTTPQQSLTHWDDDQLKLWFFLLEKTEKGKTKRKKTNGWVVVWRSMVGWCENQLNKPIHSNFSFGSFFFFSIRFKKASSWSQWNDDIIAAISHISLYIFSLFSTPFLSINQINTYTT